MISIVNHIGDIVEDEEPFAPVFKDPHTEFQFFTTFLLSAIVKRTTIIDVKGFYRHSWLLHPDDASTVVRLK